MFYANNVILATQRGGPWPNGSLKYALGPDTAPFGKYGAGYCITFIKSLDEGLGSNFQDETHDFTLVIIILIIIIITEICTASFPEVNQIKGALQKIEKQFTQTAQ